jgi:hypothetical protein
MAKRKASEDPSAFKNPFSKAKSPKVTPDAGGKQQHTIKYYVWELLSERPDGMTAAELVQEMENRNMRHFNKSSKPVSQVILPHDTYILPFCQHFV